MREKFSLFFKEVLMFGATMALGISVAWLHVSEGTMTIFEPVETTSSDIVIFVAVFLVFTAVLIRFSRTGGVALRLAMSLAVFVGAQFIASAFMSPPWPVFAGAVLAVAPILTRSHYIRATALLSRIFPIILIHNLAMIVSIAGIAALTGLSITPNMAAILLAGLSVYDIIAVYHTKHMVAIAERMMASGAVFGFLIPIRWKDFFYRGRQHDIMPRVMVLGSGDVGLPLVLAASIVPVSVPAAMMVGVFSLFGIGATHWLFMSQRRAAAMAALPPIAAAAILGYLVAILLGI